RFSRDWSSDVCSSDLSAHLWDKRDRPSHPPSQVPTLAAMTIAPSQTVKAILGPTNTGKTYFAIERMLSYPTGMIGLPLRLLAREDRKRVVEARRRSLR